MVDEPCSCLRGGWQGCCSRRRPSALSCRDQGTQEDSPPFESAVRNSSGGKAVNIEHYPYLIIVTSCFFWRQNTIREVWPLPLKIVPWYHRGPQSNRQSCPPDWCQRCPERQALVRISLYGGFWILIYGGILLTFGGVIINTPDWCQRCPVRQAWVRLISDLVIVNITTGQRN